MNSWAAVQSSRSSRYASTRPARPGGLESHGDVTSERFVPRAEPANRDVDGVSFRKLGTAHGLPAFLNSVIRVFTSRLTSVSGSGLVIGNRTVPLDISYRFSSAACARLTAGVMG